MHAELLPLDGKYYGSIIRLTDGGREIDEIKVWIVAEGHYTPSARQKAEWGDDEEETWDTHYETQTSYDIACRIVNAINQAEERHATSP